jgi:hypothetical protein
MLVAGAEETPIFPVLIILLIERATALDQKI